MPEDYLNAMMFTDPPSRSRPELSIHGSVTKTPLSPASKPVRAFGVKVGYWPCLRGPFVQVTIWTRNYQIWYGLPSYQKNANIGASGAD